MGSSKVGTTFSSAAGAAGSPVTLVISGPRAAQPLKIIKARNNGTAPHIIFRFFMTPPSSPENDDSEWTKLAETAGFNKA
jgi:hypothetical protein